MLTLVRHFLSSVFFVFSGGREKNEDLREKPWLFSLVNDRVNNFSFVRIYETSIFINSEYSCCIRSTSVDFCGYIYDQFL